MKRHLILFVTGLLSCSTAYSASEEVSEWSFDLAGKHFCPVDETHPEVMLRRPTDSEKNEEGAAIAIEPAAYEIFNTYGIVTLLNHYNLLETQDGRELYTWNKLDEADVFVSKPMSTVIFDALSGVESIAECSAAGYETIGPKRSHTEAPDETQDLIQLAGFIDNLRSTLFENGWMGLYTVGSDSEGIYVLSPDDA